MRRFSLVLGLAALLLSTLSAGALASPRAQQGPPEAELRETRTSLELEPSTVVVGESFVASGEVEWLRNEQAGWTLLDRDEGDAIVALTAFADEDCAGSVVGATVDASVGYDDEAGTYSEPLVAPTEPGTYWILAEFQEIVTGATGWATSSACVELTVVDSEGECPAAPALANEILDDYGVRGVERGEIISAVADETGQSGSFFGNDPCDYDRDDVEKWLRDNGHIEA